jgi:hypothetical protein
VLLGIALLVSPSATCKSESGLFVVGDGTPIFEIRRSFFDEVKIFPVLAVVQLHPDNEKLPPLREDDEKNKMLWKVVADPAAKDTSSVESIERIEYGIVPKGFIQEVPKDGKPPILAENQTYQAIGPLSLMRNAAVRFKIVSGKVVPLMTPQ